MNSVQETPSTITREQAKEQGLTRYFTGKPCKAGHIAERNTKSRACMECARKHLAARRKKRMETDPQGHRAAVAASVRLHYQRHSEAIKAKKKRHYAENAEAIKKRMRDNRAAKKAASNHATENAA